MALLRTSNLTVGYKKGNTEIPILSNLNLELKQGILVALVGANGIGKSTLLRTIVGNQPALSGNIYLNKCNIAEISRTKLSLTLSIVTTERTQTGGLTVKELVSLGRQPYTGFLGLLDREDHHIVEESMQAAGIDHKAYNYVSELSDGERQKAMIAKALAQQTPIIILDEPTAFLDVESRMETMLLLHKLAHEQNKAILLSSHDLSQSMILADELWIITHDRQLISGCTEDLALTGAMDRIFSSEHVKFNLEQGDFCIDLQSSHRVNLICENNILKRWIINALKRNDISIDEENNSKITINTTSRYGTISIITPHKTITVHSLSDMINYIHLCIS